MPSFMYVAHRRVYRCGAEAEKRLLLPMFTNCGYPEMVDAARRQRDYVEREILMDIYRWATPHLETIAPDIYTRESRAFESSAISIPARIIPVYHQTSGDQNMFRAIANLMRLLSHGRIEYYRQDGVVYLPRAYPDTSNCIIVIPLLLKYQER